MGAAARGPAVASLAATTRRAGRLAAPRLLASHSWPGWRSPPSRSGAGAISTSFAGPWPSSPSTAARSSSTASTPASGEATTGPSACCPSPPWSRPSTPWAGRPTPHSETRSSWASSASSHWPSRARPSGSWGARGTSHSPRPSSGQHSCSAPPLWIGMVVYGHAELPLELWLILVAVRQLGRGRTAVAGCLLGLALLTQTAALLAALPLVLALLAGRRLRSAAILLGTSRDRRQPPGCFPSCSPTVAMWSPRWSPIAVRCPRSAGRS